MKTVVPAISPEDDRIQVSLDGSTVWVHSNVDGSTVGRFSKQFGLDVHRTVSDQLAGASQCLHCTHHPANAEDWELFCQLIYEHFGIEIARELIGFPDAQQEHPGRPRPA